jgi:hypothetical protein
VSAIELPGAADLLAIARSTLLDEVIPTLEGDARFKALMVANAIAIAARVVEIGDIADLPDAAALCANIRAGAHDDDSTLGQILLAHSEARCQVSSRAKK